MGFDLACKGLILLLGTTFMQGIYNYIPETNHASRIYSFAAIQY